MTPLEEVRERFIALARQAIDRGRRPLTVKAVEGATDIGPTEDEDPVRFWTLACELLAYGMDRADVDCVRRTSARMAYRPSATAPADREALAALADAVAAEDVAMHALLEAVAAVPQAHQDRLVQAIKNWNEARGRRLTAHLRAATGRVAS